MSEEKRPEWMSSISAIVNPEDYLLGRKIDKTFELSQQEKAERAKETRINLIASDKLKLDGDPILDLERRKEQLKLEILSNPMRLRQLRDQLLKADEAQPSEHKKSKSRREEPTTSRSHSSKKKSSHSKKRHSSNKHKKHKHRDSPRNSRKHKHRRDR